MDMVFSSLDDCYSMYVKYAKECGFSVRKGTTKKNSKGVLHIKYYLCTRSLLYKDKKVDTLDPNQKERLVRSNFSKRTDCGALLCVIFEAGSWKVYKFVEEHKHDLLERPDKHFLPTKRRLTQLQKHVIHSMSKLNLGPVKAFNVMKTCFGGFEDVGASKVEFKNYKRYSMVFVPFTGIDNHHYNVTFGAALFASETADTYIWLLGVFLKVVGSQPKVVVTDQDPAMKKTIFAVFVDKRHRLCMWHVMHKLSLKVGVRLCNSTNFKERICGVVWTDILTSKEFESEWKAVIAEFNLANNDWLSDFFCTQGILDPSELIGFADCINQRYEDQPDGQTFSAWRYRDIVFGIFQIFAPPASTRDRFAEITDQYKNDKNPIRVPVGYNQKVLVLESA
ncbi:protein FAR-RED IMPAIRED RESPONSE 1-like [Helianthus annuus]|uniref:protein FAR-RED IMPAIRED RESPONSE 1-like n=1 Tax=Helianthus annuus TaxID=4232 RepID=UPI001652C6F3|nr:protein FAR-RED IMPAIRED RESPONSE 1-like [Helianthus annuus]